MTGVCRFAPSATGRAHPGTLLAGLLAWCDARCRGAQFVLRLEDLDPERCTPALVDGLTDDLRWFGLDWDLCERQSDHGDRHRAALDRLAAAGRLYPSPISRQALAAIGRRGPDGGWAYDNRERGTALPADWATAAVPLRVHLPDGMQHPVDEGGLDLAQDPAAALGDPVVRRRDGAVAYQLAVVVDDAAVDVDRIVRGRDIAVSTATQRAIRVLLGLPDPVYRHHLLLLEPRGGKFSKFHGAVAVPALRAAGHRAADLCGFLAWTCGLRPAPDPVAPRDLLDGFCWGCIATADQPVTWDGERLRRG
jgi:glutamyl/glutaminyl-tRNA synthetase